MHVHFTCNMHEMMHTTYLFNGEFLASDLGHLGNFLNVLVHLQVKTPLECERRLRSYLESQVV